MIFWPIFFLELVSEKSKKQKFQEIPHLMKPLPFRDKFNCTYKS